MEWMFILETGGAAVINKVLNGDGLECVKYITVVILVYVNAGFIILVNGI